MKPRPIVLTCPNSSVGQSSGLIIRRSSVQARLGALIRSLGFPAAHYASPRGCRFSQARLCDPVTITRRCRKMPLFAGNASAYGQAPCQLPWAIGSPSPGTTASVPGGQEITYDSLLAISGGYRFSSRRFLRWSSTVPRHLRGLPLQFQAIPTQVVCGASPSPGAIASLSTASPPKPPRGE